MAAGSAIKLANTKNTKELLERFDSCQITKLATAYSFIMVRPLDNVTIKQPFFARF